jgi:glycine/D-amino acid oxidase-like deaminating enzyme
MCALAVQGARIYADVNAVVGGYLRDLAFAQSSPQRMFGYKRAAATILALDIPLPELVEPDRARGLSCIEIASRDLRAYFEARLPALATIATESAWEGLFAMTSDSLPYIGLRYPHHWFALGYGGNGMTFGFLAARLLLERWQGVDSRDHALFAFDRLRKRR